MEQCDVQAVGCASPSLCDGHTVTGMFTIGVMGSGSKRIDLARLCIMMMMRKMNIIARLLKHGG